MKEYTEKDDNFYDFEELTSDTYETIAGNVTHEIATRRYDIDTITAEFDDKNRQIRVTEQELAKLKQRLRTLKQERREIGAHLRAEKRTLRVDINFLNKLNRSMYQGKHSVKTKERKIISK